MIVRCICSSVLFLVRQKFQKEGDSIRREHYCQGYVVFVAGVLCWDLSKGHVEHLYAVWTVVGYRSYISWLQMTWKCIHAATKYVAP